MSKDSIVILGVPVDNIDTKEAITRLFSMARAYDEDGRPRIAVLVTAEMVVRIRSSLDRQSAARRMFRKMETDRAALFTVNTLRNADLMIPAGIAVAWAARILGIKPKKRIAADNLLKSFLKYASIEGKSIVLLKKSESFNNSFQETPFYNCLFLTPPETASPCGSTLESLDEKINSAGIDFLVIDINDREIAAWFEKTKNRIYVPVILLIPGSKEILKTKPIVNASAETVVLEQSARRNLEQKIPFPRNSCVAGFFKRLYRRYFELGLTVLPLVIYQKYNQAVFNLRHKPSTIPSIKSAFPKPARSISVKIISMPDPLDASVTEDIRANIQKMSQIAPKIILDFSRVNFMDSSGLGLLMGLCRDSATNNREIFFTGVKPKIHNFFKLTKTIDFFGDKIMESLPEIIDSIRNRISNASFYYLAVLRNNAVVYNFFGKLDASEILGINTDSLLDPAAGRDVILNLAGLTFIDSAGILLIIKMHRHISKNKGILIACGMRGTIRHLFSIVRVDLLFIIEKDLHSAELALRRHHIKSIQTETAVAG